MSTGCSHSGARFAGDRQHPLAVIYGHRQLHVASMTFVHRLSNNIACIPAVLQFGMRLPKAQQSTLLDPKGLRELSVGSVWAR